MPVPRPAASRIRSSFVIALGAFVLAACDESVTAPISAAYTQIENAVLNVFGCSTSWKLPVNGDWSVAANWDNGVPDATKDACITVDGTYSVTVRGTQVARAVTIGDADNTGVQTVAIQGTGTGSSLTSATGIDNAGVITMSWVSGTNATFAKIAVTAGTLNNAGTLRTVADGIGAPRFITADLVNTGTVSIGTPTTFNKPDGVYENRGAFTVEQFRSMTMQGNLNQTFRQAEGTLTINGSMSVTQEAFEFSGGTIDGTTRPTLTNATLRIGDGNTAAGAFFVRGASTLEGNVAPAQSILIQGTGTGSTLTSATGFTNAGTIEMSWLSGTNGTFSRLAVTEGTLVNEGTIHTLPDGIGAPRFISAGLLNTGIVSLDNATTFDKAGAVYENRGDFTVEQFRTLTIKTGAGQVFRQASGTLTVDGSMILTGQTFEAGGGTMTGKAFVDNGTLRFLDGCAGTGDFSTRGLATLAGNIPAGYTVRVNTSSDIDGVLTSPTGFTNAGTIELQSTSGNNGTGVTLAVTNGTLENSGTLRFIDDAFGGSGRTVAGSVHNTGVIDIRTRVVFAKQNGVYVNDNSILLPVGHFLTITGLGQSFTTTGAITGGGSLNLTGITMRASGSIAAAVSLNTVDSHIGVGGPATLSVTGTYRMVTGGALTVELLEPTPGTGHDRLNVSGQVTLLGTLNVSVVGGACIDGGQSFEIMTFASRIGDFTTKNGLNLGNGHTLTAVPGTTNYKLNSAGPVCVPPDVTPPVITPTVTGTLGNNGWYVSDVSVTWALTDAESAISSSSGCGASSVTTDDAGITFTCSATSAGGAASQSVTIKRDATAPTVNVGRAPSANANGWNNTDVTATWTASDGMSGLVGSGAATLLFTDEGANQGGSNSFSDRAGNTASASVAGISIDMTAPTASASRAPEANANGWNNTDVTATYSATDALSGIDGVASATELFADECENTGGSHTFTDRAGNSATATVGGISIDRTAPVVSVARTPAPGPDGWNESDVTVTYSATDALSGIDGASSFAEVFLSPGENQGASHTFSDRAGNSATGTISGINIRVTPPPPPPPPPPSTVACSVTPATLWAPNNKMVAVQVTITGGVSYLLRSATNNETGVADIDGFAVGSADLDGFVRAARNGGGSGRVYSLDYDVTASSGSTTSCTVTVTVPHDQGKKK